jgi:LemA protein
MTRFLVVLGFLLLATGVVLYNRLIRSRNRVDTAWSDIDVQLQRRHDLIPNLVKAVDQYARYERATLEAVTELRAEAMHKTGVEERGEAEQELSENFLGLQNDLVETENYLQFARRYYNGSVRDLNTLIESVPSNIVASLFGFDQRGFFQKSSDDAANVPLVKLGSIE